MFNLYGILVVLAVVVAGWRFFQVMPKFASIPELEQLKQQWESGLIFMLLGGVVGARIWHVITDWSIYQLAWLDAVKIWQGGLSIYGAIFGGLLGIFIWRQIYHLSLSWLAIFDGVAYALPLGQIIGRWGNYFNQELYGLPSNQRWAIYISPTHRVDGYQDVVYFHPLFAYEILLLSGWLFLLALADKQASLKNPRLLGIRGLGYFLYYGVVRFWLDFIRLPQPDLYWGLGVNQWVVLVMTICLSGIITWRIKFSQAIHEKN